MPCRPWRMIALLVALSLVCAAFSPRPAGRGGDVSLGEYSASITTAAGRTASFEAETAEIELGIRNSGKAVWESRGKKACFVSYHILDGKKKVIRYENPRFPIPREMRSGNTAAVKVTVKAPLEAEEARQPLHWHDFGRMVRALNAAYPDVEPLDLTLTKLFKMILQLPGFDDDPHGAGEEQLEKLQMAWHEVCSG